MKTFPFQKYRVFRNTFIGIVAMIVFPAVCCAQSGSKKRDISKNMSSSVIARVIPYLFGLADPGKRHKPWFYAADFVIDAREMDDLKRRMRIDAQAVDAEWIGTVQASHRKPPFVFVSIRRPERIGRQRIKVVAYVATDLYWETSVRETIFSEAVATVYLRRVGDRWLIETKRTEIRKGE